MATKLKKITIANRIAEVIEHNITFGKIYKGTIPTQFMVEFITLCRQKETEKAITIWMDGYRQRTKNDIEILSNYNS